MLISLLLAEGLLRAALAVPSLQRRLAPQSIGFREADFAALFETGAPDSLFRLREVSGFRHVHDAGDYDYEITTVPCHGYWIRPPCAEGPAAVYHFGDSFTFGFGVENADTFVSLLRSDGVRTDVNFGVPGDNLLSELDRAIAVLSALEPARQPGRIYFHVFLGNDLREAWRHLGRTGETDTGEVAPGFGQGRSGGSALLRIVKNRLLAVRLSGKAPDGVTFVPKYLSEVERSDEKIQTRLRAVLAAAADRLRALREVYAGQILVTFTPPKEIFLVDDGGAVYFEKRDAVRDVFRPYADDFIDFLESVPPAEVLGYYFPVDTHFNQQGQARFARLLAERESLR